MSKDKCSLKGYSSNQHHHGEKRVRVVIVLTGITMVAEIIAGFAYGSMALLADGWHMGTHLFALSVTLFTYYYAKKHKDNPLFSFGTGKVGALGGFASSILLGIVALTMLWESAYRLLNPQKIFFNEALVVAVIGLAVNLASVVLMHRDHEHDYNMKAAYLHVAADTLTSLIAISALLVGKFFGLVFLDPIAGILGGAVILKWSLNLMKDTAKILLDKSDIFAVKEKMRKQLEADDETTVTDFHVWPVGEEKYALIASLSTTSDKTSWDYKTQLSFDDSIIHITIEVNYI